MAHNRSPRRIVADVLALRLRELPGGLLLAVCAKCQRQSVVSLDALSAAHGGDHRLSTVIARLRCATGREAPSGVQLMNEGKVVTLMGPGTF